MEEKPAMAGGGDDSSSSFLDFPGGGGGYDPNQPGSSRDLVPAGNQAVAAGAAGQKVGFDAFRRAQYKDSARSHVSKRSASISWYHVNRSLGDFDRYVVGGWSVLVQKYDL